MRVLIYVEPHPLRGSMIHFNDVARKFLPILGSRDGYDIRMYANSETFSRLDKEIPGDKRKSLILPTKGESDLFRDYLNDWHGVGINLWLDLMNGGRVADAYVDILKRIWKIFPFDVVVHWGENGAVTRFVEEYPVARIGMELGCTRPPFMSSIVMDPFGTNGAAIVPRLDVSDIEKIVGGKSLSATEALLAYAENIGSTAYEDQFLPPPAELPAAFMSRGKTVFLPLQLYDDANLLRFSPYKTVSDVVLDVVPKLVEGGCKVIIKPHPASEHRANARLENKIARNAIEPWAADVFWCDEQDSDYNNSRLISMSDAVVTVNSSTGFEALYYDKPVIVMGDAVYKPTGIFPTIQEFLSGDYDKNKYLYGIGLLRRFFLNGYLRPAAERGNPALFMQMVGLINGLWRLDKSPLAMASGMYQSLNVQSSIFAKTAMLKGISVAGTNEFGAPTNIAAPEQDGEKEKSVEKSGGAGRDIVFLVSRMISESDKKNVSELSAWLDEKLEGNESRHAFFERLGIVDRNYYLEMYPDIRDAEVCPVIHYATHGFLEGRSPRRGIEEGKGEMVEVLLRTAQDVFNGGAGIYPLPKDKEDSRKHALKSISDRLNSSGRKICVVAHLYYADLVDEILSKLNNIEENFDLVVTLPDWGADVIEKKVLQNYPDAVFYRVCNRGRDIAPFLDVLPLMLASRHELVLKLQTKRGYYLGGKMLPEFGDIWREESLEFLLGDAGRVSGIVSHLRGREASMIGGAPYFVSLEKYPYHDNGGLAWMLMGDEAFSKKYGFFVGTMFWSRLDCLRPLIESAGLSMLSFSDETGVNDGELADLIERVFGHLAGHANGISVIDENGALKARAQPSDQSIHQHLQESQEKRSAMKRSVHGLIW